jgi:thiol-disulfide isomerase/thioredoxin
LNLLYFTGSWCPPCKIAHSDLQKFYEKNSSKIKIIAIDKEESQLASIKYYKESNVKWDLFYLPFDCKGSSCLDKMFEINAYPTFLLIDKYSKLVASSSGSDGMKVMEDLYFKLNQQRIQ